MQSVKQRNEYNNSTPTERQEPDECEEGSYVLSLKVLSPQEWIDLYKFREASPEEQAKFSQKDIARFTEMLLSGFESISETTYPIKQIGPNGCITDNSERQQDHKEERFIDRRFFWERTNFEAVKRSNKDKQKVEKALERTTQFRHKKKLIEAFLEKDKADRSRNGEPLFQRNIEVQHKGRQVISFKKLKKTLSEEYDYFIQRDKKELKIQNKTYGKYGAIVHLGSGPDAIGRVQLSAGSYDIA